MLKYLPSTLISAGCLLAATGCDRSTATSAPSAAAPGSKPASGPTIDVEAYPLRAASVEDSFFVVCRPTPYPVPLNQQFSLEVRVLQSRERPTLVSDIVVAVDADMPEHGHGMNTTPKVNASPDGRYAVSGMLFHMAGDWEIYVDVTCNGVTERAVLPVTLE